MRTAAIATMAVALAVGVPALANTSDFDRALAGKIAGAPLRCVIPDLSANPVIQDGQAIAYFSGRKVYVNRFDKGGCLQLRRGRIAVTTTSSGLLCRNDPVTVLQPGGRPTYGFCTLGDFTPYSKTK